MVNGGGDGWKDRRTDIWKFPPVFYRTSACWDRCPKRDKKKLKTRYVRVAEEKYILPTLKVLDSSNTISGNPMDQQTHRWEDKHCLEERPGPITIAQEKMEQFVLLFFVAELSA